MADYEELKIDLIVFDTEDGVSASDPENGVIRLPFVPAD